jgi:hypothetical protein
MQTAFRVVQQIYGELPHHVYQHVHAHDEQQLRHALHQWCIACDHDEENHNTSNLDIHDAEGEDDSTSLSASATAATRIGSSSSSSSLATKKKTFIDGSVSSNDNHTQQRSDLSEWRRQLVASLTLQHEPMVRVYSENVMYAVATGAVQPNDHPQPPPLYNRTWNMTMTLTGAYTTPLSGGSGGSSERIKIQLWSRGQCFVPTPAAIRVHLGLPPVVSSLPPPHVIFHQPGLLFPYPLPPLLPFTHQQHQSMITQYMMTPFNSQQCTCIHPNRLSDTHLRVSWTTSPSSSSKSSLPVTNAVEIHERVENTCRASKCMEHIQIGSLSTIAKTRRKYMRGHQLSLGQQLMNASQVERHQRTNTSLQLSNDHLIQVTMNKEWPNEVHITRILHAFGLTVTRMHIKLLTILGRFLAFDETVDMNSPISVLTIYSQCGGL